MMRAALVLHSFQTVLGGGSTPARVMTVCVCELTVFDLVPATKLWRQGPSMHVIMV